jgi:hypothetical protein
MIKQILFYLFMFAGLVGGLYIIITFESYYKLFSLILFGAFYGFARLKYIQAW